MAVVRTGTVATASQASDIALATTVPADADIAVVYIAGYATDTPNDLIDDLSWNNAGTRTQFNQIAHAEYREFGTQMDTWYMTSDDPDWPGAGSRTLNVEASIYNEGLSVAVAYYTGVDKSNPIIDIEEYDNEEGLTSSRTTSLTGVGADDLAVAAGYNFSENLDPNNLDEDGQTVVVNIAGSLAAAMFVVEKLGDGALTMLGLREGSISLVAFALRAAEEGGGDQTITVTGIASQEAIGAAVLARIAQTLVLTGVASLEVFGTAALANVAPRTITPGGVATAEVFGTTVAANVAARSITPGGVATAEAFGTTSLSHLVQTILATSIATAEAFGDGLVSIASQIVAASSVASDEAFGATVIGNVAAQSLSVSGIATGEAFGTSNLNNVAAQNIVVTAIASGEEFGSMVISDVALVITPTGIASDEAFGSALFGGENLSIINVSSMDSLEAFGDLVIQNAVAQSIVPAAVASAEAFGSTTLLAMSQTITPAAIDTMEAFGDATFNFTLQTIAPDGIVSAFASGTTVLTGGAAPEPPESRIFVAVTQPLWTSVWTAPMTRF